MTKFPIWKLISSIILTIIAFWCVIPNFFDVKSKLFSDNRINLGLDLRGGAHLLLDIDFDTYLGDIMEGSTDNLRKHFRQEKIGYVNLHSSPNLIQFSLRNNEDYARVKKIVHNLDPTLTIMHKDSNVELHYEIDDLKKIHDKVVDQSIEIVRLRVDSTGTKEPMIQRQGLSNILLQVPGEENPQHLKNILGKTAKLTFHLVDENANMEEASKGRVAPGNIIVKGENDNQKQYFVVIKKKAIITGDQLTNAQASFNNNSQAVVNFSLNNIGGKQFAKITKNNPGNRLAIVLDNRLLCAPVINDPILGGSGVITGNFTVESANDLALLLRAGALPAPLKIIEERSIGPNLGADSIEAGKKAGIIGFASVVIFMIWSYGIFGLFANIALSLALVYIMALLTLFQATLTLPGIAGIILTIGMAVDANVLIYERIREELAKGTSNLYAIKQGFETALATITDSNITTLIAAFLLYIFGVGAIKGFAVTLTIGIISSMFSAIVVTKLLIDLWMKLVRPKRLGI